ncbi:MAG: DUF2341 domain-containing protein [Actinomycetota bacterium]
MNPLRPRLRRPALVPLLSVVVLMVTGLVLGGLAAGYRPVVILTGSMGDTAPPGALVIAAPLEGPAVVVGDILVMRRPGSAPVTHRVIEIEDAGPPPDAGSGVAADGGDDGVVGRGAAPPRFATTQGDANEAPDAAPYPLEGSQLVGRWIVPRVGGWLQTLFSPGPVLAVVALAIAAWAVGALQRIWSDPGASDPEPPEDDSGGEGTIGPSAPAEYDTSAGSTPAEASLEAEPVGARRRRLALILSGLAVPALVLGTAGVAWAVLTGNDSVSVNDFGTLACFDPELSSVQSGETVHAVDGTVTEAITAVDPASSFVLASLRSSADEPADSTVMVELGGGGTTVDLTRATDAGAPPSVTVAWSVVEYGCGVSVQRGSVVGDGTSQLTVPITTVDEAASFVLVGSAPQASATAFGGDDLFIGELADASTLRIRTAGSTFDTGREFAWQVVTFDDPGDVQVQTITTTLSLGQASTTAAIGSPVDTGATFLLTGATSASSGAAVGERLVRTHLVDGSTIAVDRSVAGEAIDVQVQVVHLKDGSNVRHGIVDLVATESAATVTIDPVDPARATAIATVATPGVAAGGMTDHVTDDVPGEASATFTVTDPTTVAVTRSASASSASFGWQVIEWAGPTWWDGTYPFRQRIDVAAGGIAAPDDYTISLAVDHAALVTSGLARADGDDVRVLRWDGSTWTELDRILDDGSTWDRSDTTLWFRTVAPVAADTTDTYWLHYGNSAATAPPADPENVLLLTEGFESGTLGDFVDRTAGTGWYQADPWTRRIPLTVPAGTVDADLADYPLLVTFSSAALAADALPDGSDIRFTAADGVSDLAHELERYDPATGSVTAWVRVPSVAGASPTTLYLYYGAADAPDQQAVREVWPDDVEAVWHLHRDPAGSAPQLDDSTTGNNDGLSGGAMTSGDLVIGTTPAVDLDGADDVLRAAAFDPTPTGALSVSGLLRLDAHTVDGPVLTKADDATTRILDLSVTTAGALQGRLSLNGSEVTLIGGTVPTGAWHHVAMTWDGATQRLWMDGVEVAAQPAVGILDRDGTMPVTVGNVATGDRPLDGAVDEVRLVNTARSGPWLDALATNLSNPGAFVSVGSVETGSWLGQGTWDHRKPLSVDHDLIPSDLGDHALLVQLTDAQLATSAAVDGRDLVFTAADGITRLDHTVETFDPGTGALSAWVRVPNLSSSTDTGLFLYYGNTSADWQQDPGAVFGAEADLVFSGMP